MDESNTEHREKFDEVNTKVDNLIKEANKEIDIDAVPGGGDGGAVGSSEAIADIMKKI